MIKFFRRLITLWRSRHLHRSIKLSPLNEDQKSRCLARVVEPVK